MTRNRLKDVLISEIKKQKGQDYIECFDIDVTIGVIGGGNFPDNTTFVTVTGELDYEDLEALYYGLNPIVQQIDEDAYFEAEDTGRAICYINEEKLFSFVDEQKEAVAEDHATKKMEVETAAGTIRVYESWNPDFHGVIVMLQPKGSDEEIDVTTILTCDVEEYEDADAADLVVRAYTDPYSEDYTNKAVIRRSDVVAALDLEEEMDYE